MAVRRPQEDAEEKRQQQIPDRGFYAFLQKKPFRFNSNKDDFTFLKVGFENAFSALDEEEAVGNMKIEITDN